MQPRQDINQELATLASFGENTVELQTYWQKRFKEMLSSQAFMIDSRTQELFSLDNIDVPFTPQGFISLKSVMKESAELDENKLQFIIEGSVRFLDNCIGVFNKTEQVTDVVSQFRKIALGVFDFNYFFQAQSNMSMEEATNYIGMLISNGAYRASEALSEEKGTCLGWDIIKYHLRPKTFEFWFHQKTGEIIDGYQMSQIQTQKTVHLSEFEIIPRRNSHILFYPEDEMWKIWSDRDETSFNTKLYFSEMRNKLPVQVAKNSTPESIESARKLEKDSNPTQSEVLEKDPYIISEAIEEKTNDYSFTSEPSRLNLQTITDEIFPSGRDHQIIIDSENESDSTNRNFSINSFQIGELVIINDEESQFYQQIAQVIHVEKDQDDQFLYQLRSNQENLESYLWAGNDLESVDLFELLDKISVDKVQTESTDVQVYLTLLVVNSHNQLLITRENDAVELLNTHLPSNSIPEHIFPVLLQEKYGLSIKNIKEVGSSVEFKTEKSPFIVNLCFTGDIIHLPESPQVDWVDFRTAQFSLNPSIRVLCNKFNRQKIENEKKYLQPQLFGNDTKDTSTITGVLNNKSQELSSMVQYILKLEQIIHNDVFGKVSVILQYSDNGFVIKEMTAPSLTPDLQYFTHVVITFSNALLLRNSSSKVVSEIIESMDKETQSIPMQSLLKIISSVLRDLPENSEKITLAELFQTKQETVASDEVEDTQNSDPQYPTDQNVHSWE